MGFKHERLGHAETRRKCNEGVVMADRRDLSLTERRACKIAETVDIRQALDKVLAIVKNVDGLATWHPAAASSGADKGNEVGANSRPEAPLGREP
jgi:hypothetical protein